MTEMKNEGCRMDKILEAFGEQFKSMEPYLDERIRRLLVASMAKYLGSGGIIKIAKITKISEETIRKGIRELGEP